MHGHTTDIFTNIAEIVYILLVAISCVNRKAKRLIMLILRCSNCKKSREGLALIPSQLYPVRAYITSNNEPWIQR